MILASSVSRMIHCKSMTIRVSLRTQKSFKCTLIFYTKASVFYQNTKLIEYWMNTKEPRNKRKEKRKKDSGCKGKWRSPGAVKARKTSPRQQMRMPKISKIAKTLNLTQCTIKLVKMAKIWIKLIYPLHLLTQQIKMAMLTIFQARTVIPLLIPTATSFLVSRGMTAPCHWVPKVLQQWTACHLVLSMTALWLSKRVLMVKIEKSLELNHPKLLASLLTHTLPGIPKHLNC